MNRKVHAGFASSGWGPSTLRKLRVSASSDWNVILHHALTILQQLQIQAEHWLTPMGLHLKASKTKICHTLEGFQGKAGFDFLGFTIRQFRVGRYKTRSYRGQAGFKTIISPSRKSQQRHLAHLKQIIRTYRGSSQAGLMGTLNPRIRGWANYYRPCCAKQIFNQMTARLFHKLLRWAAFRHPRQDKSWCYRRYWRRYEDKVRFSDGEVYLYPYEETKVRRHTKVMSHKSPYDGDWVYWANRLGQDPLKPLSWVKLLKRQWGKCEACGLRLTTQEVLEVHHLNGNRADNRYANLSLLHGHCHDLVHARCL